MKIKSVLAELENWAPRALQESYDNAKLIVGDKEAEVKGIVTCLDCTEDVVNEAVRKGCNLIVAHHPIVFSGLKQLVGANYIERTLLLAIRNDIAIYAIHTNLDNVNNGVNAEICKRLKLGNTKILSPKKEMLSKLNVYGTPSDIEKIREAIFLAGGGHVGEYSECSFTSHGKGTFKPSLTANPSIGVNGERETLDENKVEVVVPNYLMSKALQAAKEASSYEELAYEIIALENVNQTIGSGMIGELDDAMSVKEFLLLVKKVFNCGSVKYTQPVSDKVKKVAVCGGSGSFLLPHAIAQNADIFITSDFKYHQFFDADKQIVIADIGHYESEQFTIDLLAEFLKQKFNTFAVFLTEVNTNPVNYL